MNSKNYLHLLISVVIFGVIKIFVSPVNGLTTAGVNMLGMFLAIMYMWITIGITWPSWICIVGTSLAGFMTPAQVFSNSFGHWIVPFIICILMINHILNKQGLSNRIAVWFITRRFIEGRPWLLIGMFLFAAMCVGFVMSNLPTAVLFMTIAESIFCDLGYKKGDRLPTLITVCINVSVALAYGATPISHSTPVLVIGFLQSEFDYTVNFFKYMSVGIPLALIFFVLMMLVLRFVFRPDVSGLRNYDLKAKRAEVKPMETSEKISAAIFALLILTWLFPAFGGSFAPGITAYLNKLGYVIPTIIAMLLMCLIQVKGEPVGDFRKALTAVNWSSVVFVGCIMLLGTGLSDDRVGLPVFMEHVLTPIAQQVSPIFFIGIMIAFLLLLTNFLANAVAVVLVYTISMPVILMLVNSGAPDVELYAFAVMIAIVGNYAFLMPTANLATPVIMSTGWLSTKDLIKYSWPFVIIAFMMLFFVGYPLARLIF